MSNITIKDLLTPLPSCSDILKRPKLELMLREKFTEWGGKHEKVALWKHFAKKAQELGIPLDCFFESALEMRNKESRIGGLGFARKTFRKDNIQDMFNFLCILLILISTV